MTVVAIELLVYYCHRVVLQIAYKNIISCYIMLVPSCCNASTFINISNTRSAAIYSVQGVEIKILIALFGVAHLCLVTIYFQACQQTNFMERLLSALGFYILLYLEFDMVL